MFNPWWVSEASESAVLRLFCFSYAGGSAAAFMGWQKALGPAIEVCAVQLPGRGRRFREPLISSMSELVPQLSRVIAGHRPLPFAFFGHSMGALVAFELSRELMRQGGRSPEKLLVSASNAPRHLQAEQDGMHLLKDEDFLQLLRSSGGAPAEMFENFAMVRLMLPTIRADFSLVETYRYAPLVKLGTPIVALFGQADEHTSEPLVAEWASETECEFRMYALPGAHFFLTTAQERVVALVARELRACVLRGDHAKRSSDRGPGPPSAPANG